MPTQPYNPVGALGGLFAPAFIRGNPQSEDAVTAWQAQQRPVTPQMVDQLRTPPSVPASGTLAFGDPRGTVPTDVLRAAAQGGPYDVQARRDQIAHLLTTGGPGTGGGDTRTGPLVWDRVLQQWVHS